MLDATKKAIKGEIVEFIHYLLISPTILGIKSSLLARISAHLLLISAPVNPLHALLTTRSPINILFSIRVYSFVAAAIASEVGLLNTHIFKSIHPILVLALSLYELTQ